MQLYSNGDKIGNDIASIGKVKVLICILYPWSTEESEEKHMETMVYLASDIQKALGLGKSKTYLFLDEVYRQRENPPFRVIKVGKLFRVPKKSFDDWLNATQ